MSQQSSTPAAASRAPIRSRRARSHTTRPLAGSYYVESLTSEVEAAAQALIDEIDERGGLVACIETGWIQAQVADSAYLWRQEVESGERVLVGSTSTRRPRRTRPASSGPTPRRH